MASNLTIRNDHHHTELEAVAHYGGEISISTRSADRGIAVYMKKEQAQELLRWLRQHVESPTFGAPGA